MNRSRNTHVLKIGFLFILLMALLLTGRALAQPGGGYDLTWHSVDGGGATLSTGGGYALAGTAGQPDAGALSGGGYTLAGGLWGSRAVECRICLPLIMRR